VRLDCAQVSGCVIDTAHQGPIEEIADGSEAPEQSAIDSAGAVDALVGAD
jgi:hypothetical protein